jgi:C2 domain
VVRLGAQEFISEVVYKTLTPVWEVTKNSFVLYVEPRWAHSLVHRDSCLHIYSYMPACVSVYACLRVPLRVRVLFFLLVLTPEHTWCVFFYRDITEARPLEIHLWDRDRATKDDYMGYVCLQPVEYMKTSAKCKQWLPLLKPKKKKKDRGHILISLQYMDYTHLLDMIISDRDVVPRVCLRTVKNDLAHAVVALYLCKRISLPLIKTLIQKEVERTSM